MGDLRIDALSDNNKAKSDARGSGGGLVGVGAAYATSTASSDVEAYMKGSVGSDTTTGAVDLDILASAEDTAIATAQAVAGGLVAGTDNDSNATANSKGDAKAVLRYISLRQPLLDAAASGRMAIAEALTSGAVPIEYFGSTMNWTSACHRPQPAVFTVEQFTSGQNKQIDSQAVASIPDIGDGSPCSGEQVAPG